MPLSLAHLAKAFHWALYTWLEESRNGSVTISTTASGKSCSFKMSLIVSMLLDLTGEAPCETGTVACWARTGKEPCRSAECEDVGWVVVVGGATDETGSGSRRELSDWSRAVPTGELLDGWLLVPASWCADWHPVETIDRIGDDLANWLPSLLRMHPWKRTGWVR